MTSPKMYTKKPITIITLCLLAAGVLASYFLCANHVANQEQRYLFTMNYLRSLAYIAKIDRDARDALVTKDRDFDTFIRRGLEQDYRSIEWLSSAKGIIYPWKRHKNPNIRKVVEEYIGGLDTLKEGFDASVSGWKAMSGKNYDYDESVALAKAKLREGRDQVLLSSMLMATVISEFEPFASSPRKLKATITKAQAWQIVDYINLNFEEEIAEHAALQKSRESGETEKLSMSNAAHCVMSIKGVIEKGDVLAYN
jgi:hypothetical protein